MSWLQIELRATPASLTHIEEVLQTCGALATTLLSDADEPVLEPNPGETPLWTSVKVQALFPLATDMAALRVALDRLDCGELDVAFVGAADWQSAARAEAVDEVFANRLRLLPKGAAAAGDFVHLYLEPGLAFGSGSHPTTRLCLAWLAAHLRPGQHVLDFGCGSGVLGIAACLLGATAVAVDHDPQAIMATRENAAYNGVDDARLLALELPEWQAAPANEYAGTFDVIVANILAGPLQMLAEEFENVAVPGAAIVLSGVLEEQADTVMASYRQTDFQEPTIEQGWARLVGVRRASPVKEPNV